MEDDFLPPPDDFGGTDDAPPPLDDFGGTDDAPPPLDDLDSDMPPPPMEEDASAPPSFDDDDLAPPPLEDAFADSDDLAPPTFDDEEEMAPPPAPVKQAVKTVKKAAAPAAGTSRYNVVRGDSLWKIAGKKSIYSNSFKWPLLFRANKNIIEDPDLIYPRQNLQVRKNFTGEEVKDAVRKAKETPPYEPHTTPRKQLPIKY